MVENTKIEWAHHTFNPWIGCMKVGPGCDHCYAETLATARLGVAWGAGAPRRRTAPSTWKQPLAWNRRAEREGVRYRVFCSSLADVFDNEVDPAWRADLFELIRITPHLDWLLLTKRIGNAGPMIDRDGALAGNGFRYVPDNVWLGATVVNQAEADRDVEKLRAMKKSHGVHRVFLSIEPLLGPLNITHLLYDECSNWIGDDGYPPMMDMSTGQRECCSHCDFTGVGELAIDWVIVGGESGSGARPMHPDWARSLRDQCAAAGVPFLFKQWGEWLSGLQYNEAARAADPDLEGSRFVCMDWDGEQFEDSGGGWMDDLDENAVFRVGKKLAGRLLDGIQHDGVPA